ncbi:hypothetical protein AVEN_91209-1 [Araneus ventricosus]|uniref:Uncharacterized protein n=1 Tax=Araneus ventricosus TaxID=182803 RepID=A0A4Y2HHP7_ARAVE|nr:hypothetical protein AVEN_91209-1 [Araneus ventricosus]
MNYFSVIRPPSGQIAQPQSCAFLPGDDWKRSTLDRSSLSATHGWPTSQGNALPGPLWAWVWPGRFMTLTFPLVSLRGLRCVVLTVVGKR